MGNLNSREINRANRIKSETRILPQLQNKKTQSVPNRARTGRMERRTKGRTRRGNDRVNLEVDIYILLIEYHLSSIWGGLFAVIYFKRSSGDWIIRISQILSLSSRLAVLGSQLSTSSWISNTLFLKKSLFSYPDLWGFVFPKSSSTSSKDPCSTTFLSIFEILCETKGLGTVVTDFLGRDLL